MKPTEEPIESKSSASSIGSVEMGREPSISGRGSDLDEVDLECSDSTIIGEAVGGSKVVNCR